MSEKPINAVAVIGIDIGKNSFHVVGLDQRGAIVLRQKWSRSQVEARFANMPPCLVHRPRSAFLSAFKLSTYYSVDVAHGLVLLFGIGTKALPSWDPRTRWINLRGGLAVRGTAGPSGHSNSPYPSSCEGHHSTARVELEFSPIAFDPAWRSCGYGFPGPPELGAVNPNAVHDHGQPTGQGYNRLFHPAAPGDLHRPGLEPGPFRRTHQHCQRRLVEHHPHHLVSAP